MPLIRLFPFRILLMTSIYLLLIHTLFGQISISGKIEDESNNPVPYVNIGISEKGVGTVSDREGNFYFEIPEELLSYTIRFSHINYLPVDFKTTEVPKLIILNKNIQVLEPVLVTSTKYKEKELGNHSEASWIISGLEDLGGEIGRKFSIKEPSLIIKFGFHVSHNTFDLAHLRLKVYNIDNKLPGKLISSNNYIKIEGMATGHMELMITKPLEVFEDVIITLELVEYSPHESGYVHFSQKPPYMAKMYYRGTSLDKIKKYIGGPMSMFITIKY